MQLPMSLGTRITHFMSPFGTQTFRPGSDPLHSVTKRPQTDKRHLICRSLDLSLAESEGKHMQEHMQSALCERTLQDTGYSACRQKRKCTQTTEPAIPAAMSAAAQQAAAELDASCALPGQQSERLPVLHPWQCPLPPRLPLVQPDALHHWSSRRPLPTATK